ncbi:MAG: hypothetical protein V3S41_03375 [Spirochaetia bacterium]
MGAKIKKMTLTGLMLVAVVIVASAYGGGGFFQATQMAFSGYTNMDSVAEVEGGYGYGVSRGGRRYGGFGMVVSEAETQEFLGGFGGVISGRQMRTGPFTLSLNIWSGVGYASQDLIQAPAGVAFLAEANAEAGFAVLPWLQISVYGGYQAIGPFDPSAVFANTKYVPVIGARVSWGSF